MVTNCTKAKTVLHQGCLFVVLALVLGKLLVLFFFLVMSPPYTPFCINDLGKEYGKTGNEIALDALGILLKCSF